MGLGLAFAVAGWAWWLHVLGALVFLGAIPPSPSAWWRWVRTGEEPAPDPPADCAQPGSFRVVLEDSGPKRVETVKALREVIGVGSRQALAWVVDPPVRVATDLSRASADRVRARLEQAGARSRVEDGSVR